MFEFYISLDGFPVFSLRIETVAVFCDDFLAVCNSWLQVKQVREPSDIYLSLNQKRQHFHKPSYGLHQILCVAHEE